MTWWLALMVLVAPALAGCGSETTIKTVQETVTVAGEPTTETSDETEPEVESSLLAQVGDAITLHGNAEGSEVRVTVLKVAQNAKSSNEFIEPSAGKRYFAIRLLLENTGTAVYEDSPSNGTSVIDTKDQEYDATFIEVAEPTLGSLKVRPSDRRVGWIPFEIPKNAQIRTFQFALDSGFAEEAGEWTLG